MYCQNCWKEIDDKTVIWATVDLIMILMQANKIFLFAFSKTCLDSIAMDVVF
jgi:hypothetical protein